MADFPYGDRSDPFAIPSPLAEGDGVSRFSTAGPSWSAGSSTYFSQTAASELAAAQIAAHSPAENSAIAVIDAILLSRSAACRSARSRDDGRSPSPRLMTE